MAAELAIACCGAAGERRLLDAVRAFGVSPRRLVQYGDAIRVSQLRSTVDAIPEDSPFIDKVCVFTGALSLARADAAQLVVNAGGQVASSVSRKVDYLVVGIQDTWRLRDGERSSKMIKAAELAAAGAPIELLSEDDFLRMLPG
jgi:DNA polymerase-3 subunit epsilon